MIIVIELRVMSSNLAPGVDFDDILQPSKQFFI